MTPSDDRLAMELEIELPATPEQVWDAIATGPGISSWLHPTEVDGRVGGAFRFDMGGGNTHVGEITAWDPPHRFVDEADWRAGDDERTARLASEWIVQARSGGTSVLRLVTSGFLTGGEWDGELEGFSEAMRTALDNLRVYLTHFAGERGEWVSVGGTVAGGRSLSDAWAEFTGALAVEPSVGARVSAADGAPALSGTVDRVFDGKRRRNALLLIDSPARGFANVTVFGEARRTSVEAYLFGDGAKAVADRESAAWREWMDAKFPATG